MEVPQNGGLFKLAALLDALMGAGFFSQNGIVLKLIAPPIVMIKRMLFYIPLKLIHNWIEYY
jgi:hypothetical protein